MDLEQGEAIHAVYDLYREYLKKGVITREQAVENSIAIWTKDVEALDLVLGEEP